MSTTAERPEPNRYTTRWFEVFLDGMPADVTEQEVDAITHHVPRARFPRILDVACGSGRIAIPLIDLGYEVTGVDRDRSQLDRAREQLGERQAKFIAVDLRDLALLRGPFDCVLSVWQSLGYFDSSTNDAVLSDMADLLRPNGRLLLDLYHPGFFAKHSGSRDDPRDGVQTIANEVVDGRLQSEITYTDGTVEAMDFEAFDPDDLARRAAIVDLELVDSCCWWDSTRPPTPEEARYQLIFERV